MSPMRTTAPAVAALAYFSIAAPAQAQATAPAKSPPKLVVFMAVDGFPQEQLLKYYDLYGEGGFRLLLDKGAWYGNNHYSHATTYTSVGHATLLSCAHPYKHGIIGNDWLDKKTKQRVYSTEDARHRYLDEETPKHAGTSPFNIKVTAVGDELIYANGKSKVISISGKDRSAIGLGGQNGTAYMHSTSTGRFITSDYYMPDYPQWWKDFYKDKPQDKYFGQSWTPLLPECSIRSFGAGRSPLVDQLQGTRHQVPALDQRRRRRAQQELLRRDAVDALWRFADARFRQGRHRGRTVG